MRGWIYKTDEAGNPRRFSSHREAAWWATLRAGTLFGPMIALGAVRTLYLLFFSAPHIKVQVTIFVTLLVSAFWICASAIVYLYLNLAGGIMSRAERSKFERQHTVRH